ncbi:hypothetical protein L1887_35748 [Cichorium endivia]|nr:hypothetical protein L1887_35748 [Cichorium endivia]
MDCSSLKLIIEKGPREGETLEYASGSVVKIGRVVRGNTIGIKDAGISSKHISIQFDNESSKWNLTDLDSSNGTILNGKMILPNVPSPLDDGDCIKIGELTSIVVKIGVQPTIPSERNPRRAGKFRAAAVDESGLGLGLDDDLGKNAVEEPVQKRNLRSRAKKAVESKNERESLNSKRILRSSKKEDKATSIPTLNQIPEDTIADVREPTDQIAPIERKQTRGRKKQLPDLDKENPAAIVVPVNDKRTRRGRKGLTVEPLDELQPSESVRVHVSEESTSTQDNHDKDPTNPTESAVENRVLEANNESTQDHVAEGSMKENDVDTSRWQDLEKMTLGDFFDYLKWYLPKEIRDKTEEIISQLPEKTREYREARLQRNEKSKSKQSMD